MNKELLFDFGADENKIFIEALMMMTKIANAAGEGWAYRKKWNNDFRCQEINDLFEKKFTIDESFWRQVFNLPVEQKIILGFRYLSKEDNDKMLIPIWIWNLLPSDMYIEDGGKTVKELDNDTRGGVVFWKV